MTSAATKRVLLLNSPPIREKADKAEETNDAPRLGVASMAAVLVRAGVETEVVDVRQDLTAAVRRFRPDIVGMPAWTFEVHDAAQAAALVKSLKPDTLLAVGGPHPSALPEATLREFPQFDIAAVGEGEETILELARGKPLAEVKGIAYRENGMVQRTPARPPIPDLTSLPPPAWQLFDFSHRRTHASFGSGKSPFRGRGMVPYVPMEGARGCPFGCTFCFRVNGRVMRYKSGSRVADEMEAIVARFGPSRITFVEGTFGVDRNNALEICRELIKRGLPREAAWDASTRVDTVDPEVLAAMREAGCVQLNFGIESGDDYILKMNGKGTTRAKILRAVQLCKASGIHTVGSFIIGHPYETEATIKNTIGFARSLPIAATNFAIMVPFPGTEVRRMAEAGLGGLRILSNDWRLYGKQIGATMELEAIPRAKLLKYQAKAYLAFYTVPWRLPYFLRGLNWGRVRFALERIAGLALGPFRRLRGPGEKAKA